MPRSKGTSRKGKPKKADRAAGMGQALHRAQFKKFKPKSNGSSSGAGMASSGAGNIGMASSDPMHSATATKASVLETDNLTDFLNRATLADREFVSEKEQFVVLDSNAQQVVYEDDDRRDEDGDDRGFRFKELSIPKRPKWNSDTTPEELDRDEKEAFLDWRRSIARHEETIAARAVKGAVGHAVSVTPFEKNLEVWRQLWRVLERSDCVAMVVDGRNPLFYVSMDVREYVEEELGKGVVVVVNKCDYLTEVQRGKWHDYLSGLGLDHVFFSAVQEQDLLDRGVVQVGVSQESKETGPAEDDDTNDEPKAEIPESNEQPQLDANKEEQNKDKTPDTTPTTPAKKSLLDPNSIGIQTPLTRSQLIQILSNYTRLHLQQKSNQPLPSTTTTTTNGHIEIGMIGFPNVGKSSVLNVLIGAKKHDHSGNRVGVASQPGKTRHFQTLSVPDHPDITLCDCPGLVFPSFVSNVADLIVAGVFPLTQVRDFMPAVELVVQRIPRVVLEAFYGIELPGISRLDRKAMVMEGVGLEDCALPPPTAEELLTTYCLARSLLASSSGVPDHHRAAKVVLSDYVTGKLLFCHAPPPPPSRMMGDGGDGGDGSNDWEVSFQRETISTALARVTRLRERLAVAASNQNSDKNAESSAMSEYMPNLDEDDMDMLDFIEGGNAAPDNQDRRENGGNRGKKHKSMQKWGKKGRKNRNKDPYGCHVEPDEELLGSSGRSGLSVNAGKYSSSGYTRANYAGAKGAVAFTR